MQLTWEPSSAHATSHTFITYLAIKMDDAVKRLDPFLKLLLIYKHRKKVLATRE